MCIYLTLQHQYKSNRFILQCTLPETDRATHPRTRGSSSIKHIKLWAVTCLGWCWQKRLTCFSRCRNSQKQQRQVEPNTQVSQGVGVTTVSLRMSTYFPEEEEEEVISVEKDCRNNRALGSHWYLFNCRKLKIYCLWGCKLLNCDCAIWLRTNARIDLLIKVIDLGIDLDCLFTML